MRGTKAKLIRARALQVARSPQEFRKLVKALKRHYLRMSSLERSALSKVLGSAE